MKKMSIALLVLMNVGTASAAWECSAVCVGLGTRDRSFEIVFNATSNWTGLVFANASNPTAALALIYQECAEREGKYVVNSMPTVSTNGGLTPGQDAGFRTYANVANACVKVD